MRGGGIWHTILLLMLASVIMGVIQLAIVFLIIWGMLFRTRETVGILIFLFVLGLVDRYPWAGVSMLALIILAGFRKPRSEPSGTKHKQTLPPPPH